MPGTYQFEQAQSECVTCKTRYYCPDYEMHYPDDCPQGQYCDGTGRDDTESCPTGTFSNLFRLETADECQDCVSGAYCTTTGRTDIEGQCSSGYFCKLKSTSATPGSLVTNFGPCPAYLYCDASSGTGVGQGTPCLPGTFDGSGTLAALTECTGTQQGYYSNTIDMTDPIAPTMSELQCAEGYYCPHSGNSAETQNAQSSKKDQFCDQGQYCPIGSHQTTTCPGGTFQFNKVQGECLECPAGYFCPLTAT